jgi:atypical dual specificity phosphatase
MAILGHPQSLWAAGVRGVVNMCCEYGGPVDAYKTIGIKQLRLPSVDHFEPSIEYMSDAVKFIDSFKKRGEKVYVHCKAGHGRAASIALCWMIYEHRKSQLSLEVSFSFFLSFLYP